MKDPAIVHEQGQKLKEYEIEDLSHETSREDNDVTYKFRCKLSLTNRD